MTQQQDGRWFERGREHQNAGRLIEAMLCYRRALRSDARSLRAHFRLGEVLCDLGYRVEARAAWQAGLAVNQGHLPMLLALAADARARGALDEAIAIYRRILRANTAVVDAVLGSALSQIEQGDEAGYSRLVRFANSRVVPASFWDDLARVVADAERSTARTSLLEKIVAGRSDRPALLLACAAEEMIELGQTERAREVLARAERQEPLPDKPETLRRLGLAAARIGSTNTWAERYAQRCVLLRGSGGPLHWPRRTSGAALRVAYIVAYGNSLRIDDLTIDTGAYLREVVAPGNDRVVATVYNVGDAPLSALKTWLPATISVATLGPAPDAALSSAIMAADADAVIDLVGLSAPIGPLLAQGVARTSWAYSGFALANAAPLVAHTLPSPRGADASALAEHRTVLEAMLTDTCASAPWFADVSKRTSAELIATWRAAVAAHQSGAIDAALAGYEEVLKEQPAYVHGQYLLGVLLRDVGRRDEAVRALAAAVEHAPAYLDARVALADLYRETGPRRRAIELCEAGLRVAPDEPLLWRTLGLTQLARRDGMAAREAFKKALVLAPADATTHYNEGVALQLQRKHNAALRAYRRALALSPDLVSAEFNIGIIFREQGHPDRAIKAFERVLARDPKHVPAHKALVDTLRDQWDLPGWFQAFDRFEAACPDALALLVVALEVCQYRADFVALDRYLDRLQREEFKPPDAPELGDCLEELLFLLIYFDFDPEALLGLYKAYDTLARRVYMPPLALPESRKPGRIRLGYVSGDLRNHVMGKMMWPAVERHDRKRFELFFYALSSASDDWTERYRGLGDHFEVIANLSEQEAAARIAADELDILIDLSTHTRGSKPGIFAYKPARVQITHVASAGPTGLSMIDFKLTDAFCDLPEMQPLQLETFLPMSGCVYPYRHVESAVEPMFTRDRLGIASDKVVVGAFVNPLKLSRRCLALWRDVLAHIPDAVLAISPMSPDRLPIYTALFRAGGIDEAQVRVLPQGRSDAENQARYNIIDFVLDPMPYGGVNGTLEALDMGVPVVTLVGRKHGERSTYSILANLGVTQTVATSGSQYVEIAVKLAKDLAFRKEVKTAIAAGLQRSPLTDMDMHTRNLEDAYVRALERTYPPALGALAASSERDSA